MPQGASGELQEWIVRVTNNGPFTARDVVTTVTLPAGVTLVQVTGNVVPVGSVLTFTLDKLDSGDTQLYYIMVTLDAPGTIEVLARTESDTMDPDSDNNDAELTQVVV